MHRYIEKTCINYNDSGFTKHIRFDYHGTFGINNFLNQCNEFKYSIYKNKSFHSFDTINFQNISSNLYKCNLSNSNKEFSKLKHLKLPWGWKQFKQYSKLLTKDWPFEISAGWITTTLNILNNSDKFSILMSKGEDHHYIYKTINNGYTIYYLDNILGIYCRGNKN